MPKVRGRHLTKEELKASKTGTPLAAFVGKLGAFFEGFCILMIQGT
jgi:hypothetical protein